MRVDRDRGAGPGEAVEDRALAAVVDDRDPGHARVAEDVRLAGRDGRGQRAAGHRRLLADGGQRLLHGRLARHRDRLHRAGLPEVDHKRARVDSRQRHEAALMEPVGPRRPTRLAHHDRPRVRASRLAAAGRNAVVADHRRREDDDLLRVARVGDDLLVARHRGREDRLAERKALSRDRVAAENGPVLEDQEPVHPRSPERGDGTTQISGKCAAFFGWGVLLRSDRRPLPLRPDHRIEWRQCRLSSVGRARDL